MKTTSTAVHVLALIALLAFGIAEDALGETGAKIGLNFTGTNQTVAEGSFVPDANGAVGPNHIVEMINRVYTVYDKATGQLLQRMRLDDFWLAAGQRGPEPISLGPPFRTDPRVVYDPTTDRWYAVTLDGPESRESRVYLGVSISSDPTFPIADLARGWKGLVIDGDPAEPNTRWADYPGLGFDADGVYVTAQLLNVNTALPFRRDYMVVSAPKADLLSSTPTIANRSVHELSGDNAIAQCAATILQPVIDVGPSDGTASVFSANGTLGMQRWDLANAGVQVPGGATLFDPIQVPVDLFTKTPNGAQPDNSPELWGFSTSVLVCPSSPSQAHFDVSTFNSPLVQQGDSMWGALAVEADGRAGIRWYEINAQTGVVRQEGTIADRHLDLIYPSVAANPFGDVVIGFTATGEEKFPSAYAIVGDTVDGVTTFGELMELKAGANTFNDQQGGPRNRWADYTTTVLDPSDPFSFWTYQPFTQAKDQWAVQITQILLPGAAPRRDEIAVGPALAALTRDNVVGGIADGLGDTRGRNLTGDLQSVATVGETDNNLNGLDRLIAKFELPDRPDASHLLQEATLRIFLEKIEGDPAGPLSVLHSVSDNGLVSMRSDYENASYGDSLDLFQLADAVTGQYYDIDVTDLVRADYAQDGAHAFSAFRLQINAASFLEDNVSHRYTVTASGTGRPALLLSFVPEPATAMLAVGLLWGLAGWSGRRRPPFVLAHHSGKVDDHARQRRS